MSQVVNSAKEMQRQCLALQRAGNRIGLIPTMGALHEGHLSLVRRAKAECDVAVATIFVNPAQFAPTEDFSKYPRSIDADLGLLDSVDCDFTFVPSADEIYPPGFSTYLAPPAVAQPLEGVFRPDHFRGVCTVVLKLFNLAPADVACFGQKDYQQALVVRHMVRDLNLPLAIEVCPTVREADGLALSSRNRYLSEGERRQALALSQALAEASDLYRSGGRNSRVLAERMQAVDAETLQELDTIDRSAVALIACYVGTTRLIDNMILS
jgi:pantoate--beta-alanine ligase